MPTRYVIDVGERLVSTTFSGILTLDDVVRHIALPRNDPKFDTGFSEIVDLSDALDEKLGYEDFKHLAELDPFSKISKRAFVIPSSKVVWGSLECIKSCRMMIPESRFSAARKKPDNGYDNCIIDRHLSMTHIHG